MLFWASQDYSRLLQAILGYCRLLQATPGYSTLGYSQRPRPKAGSQQFRLLQAGYPKLLQATLDSSRLVGGERGQMRETSILSYCRLLWATLGYLAAILGDPRLVQATLGRSRLL